MGRITIKIKDYYLEWSTVVDAPITEGMKLDAFKEWYKQEYGNSGLEKLNENLKIINEKGIGSRCYDTVDEFISFNRAGPKESCLSKDEIYSAYCLGKEIRGNWKPS